jgi:ElaB/YqjD/DUF883 family membrane-anchored ribosome-binding protein
LKVNPDLLDYFAFFSDLHEHVKNKTTNPLLISRNLSIEFILIKAVKAFKQITERLDRVLKELDPNYQPLSQEKEMKRLRSFKRRLSELEQEEFKQPNSIILCNDRYLTPNPRKHNLDIPVEEEPNGIRCSKPSRFLLESKSSYEEDAKQLEVKEEDVKIKIEEIVEKAKEVAEEEKEVEDANKKPIGAASYLLKHNPLARAMMTAYKVPGWKMKRVLARQPLPIKEIPDEDFEDEFENEIHLEPEKTTEQALKGTMKKQLIPSETLNTIIDILYEALNIAREESESMSRTINEAEMKYLIN